MNEWIGLDIGGANIKIAGATYAVCLPFALWKHPDQLTDFLRSHLPEGLEYKLAVTMTGELADAFPSKKAGVEAIVDSVVALGVTSTFYQTSGSFVESNSAKKHWLSSAAANWHATATWLSQEFEIHSGLLIDIGSTTIDLTPLVDGQIAVEQPTDLGRLKNGQLLYTGIRRSPLNGFVDTVKIDGIAVSVANEFFATAEDVYVVLGDVEPSEKRLGADGRSMSVENSKARIARLVCSDIEELGEAAVSKIAKQIKSRHQQLIADKASKQLSLLGKKQDVYLCGEGEWLFEEILRTFFNMQPIKLSEHLTKEQSTAAAAFAVRELATKLVEPQAK